MTTKEQGWTDVQTILSLILLNLAGGTSVEDIERLQADEGLSLLLLRVETYGMKRNERRAYEKRFRQEKKRAFPSASAIRRYLERYHNAGEEKKRQAGTAFIPQPTALLQKLAAMQNVLLAFAQQQNPSAVATLDQDATLVATHKSTAYYSYENYKAYQPFNTYWHEQGLVVHSEFRDGNIPAGFEQLRLLKASLEALPEGVKKVYLRSDSAGYQQALLKYCAQGNHERFGVIEFVVAADVTTAFKTAVSEVKETDWQPLYREGARGINIKTEQEWTEVCYVPTWAGYSKNAPIYRFLAIRERMMIQQPLAGIEALQQELPFQTIQLSAQPYKLFGLVT